MVTVLRYGDALPSPAHPASEGVLSARAGWAAESSGCARRQGRPDDHSTASDHSSGLRLDIRNGPMSIPSITHPATSPGRSIP